MDNLPKIVVELGKCIASSEECWKSQGLKADMKILKSLLQELNCKRSVLQKILAKQHKLGVIFEVKGDAESWLKSAQEIEGEINVVEDKVRKVKYFSRSYLDKVVVEKIHSVKELLDGCKIPEKLVTLCRDDKLAFTPRIIIRSESETTFERKVEEIWESLQDPRITKIGVFGMPGIGKTTALTHIKERISKQRGMFENVIWVTVSSDSSISTFQDKIADQLHFVFLNEAKTHHISEESARALMLSSRLDAKNRFLLILDDLWQNYNLSDVGIPEPTPQNGCKIVLTTRSIDVCKHMEAKEIGMELHTQTEAMKLFKEKVGDKVHNKLLSDQTLVETMRKIVQECAGLPLAIVTTARRLKDTIDHEEWEDALEDLRELSQEAEPIKKIIKILKLSFEKLSDGLKKCLLYCALFPEDHEIIVESLIEHFVPEELVEKKETRQSETQSGGVMVKGLQDACLLTGTINHDGEICVKMHDLIRDMALQISTEKNYRYLVKSGAKWESIHDDDKWSDDLTKVSLVHIKDNALSSEPPNTPSLLTFFLYQSYDFRYISDEFFLHMKGLSVLDLSFTAIVKLPESISDLVSLTALFLRKCFSLRYVPSLEKLQKLTKLDFYHSGLKTRHSGIKFTPEGLDMLFNLRYLNFDRCPLFIMPSRVLRKLINLQYLALPRAEQGPTVKAEDLELLEKLEAFEGVFYDAESFNTYVKSLQHKRLSHYILQLGSSDYYADYEYDQDHSRSVYLTGNLDGTRRSSTTTEECLLFLPKDVDVLAIRRCHSNITSLCDLTFVSDVSELRLCHVEDCGGIEYLFSYASSNEFPLLPRLEVLNLDDVRNLRGLIKTERALPLPNGSFFFLKELSMSKCSNVKTLFAFEIASLPNLEQFTLSRCEQLEEIVSFDHSNAVVITMPKLRRLILSNLPMLQNVPLIADSLQEIHIDGCPKLQKISPILDKEQYPVLLTHVCIDQDTWGQLKWESNNAKQFIMSLMNLTPDSGEEAPASAAVYVPPINLEEEEVAALFRRNLDIVIALLQCDFRNFEEVETWFGWNIQNTEEAAAALRGTSFQEPTAFFRRNLEAEELQEVSFFWQNLDAVLVAFNSVDLRITALFGRNLHVEVCIKKTLEITSLFWVKLSDEQALSRRNLGEAAAASALLRRELKPLCIAQNSELIWFMRNLPTPPFSRDNGEANLFRRKLDSFIWRSLRVGNWMIPAYVLFMPHTGYYESGHRINPRIISTSRRP